MLVSCKLFGNVQVTVANAGMGRMKVEESYRGQDESRTKMLV